MKQEVELQNSIRQPAWIILLSSLGFLCMVRSLPALTAKQSLNWFDVISAFNRFLDDPSTERAASLASLLPKDTPDPDLVKGDHAEALHHILAAENFGILSTEAALGNKDAVAILLRLLNFAYGIGAEEISGAIGRVIRFKPKLFLQVMRENWDMSLIRKSGPPVDFPLYAYNNHLGAYRHELERRIEALASVKDPTLAFVKEACLKRLAETFKGLH